MDHLSSLFIDDEMNLQEKISFVRQMKKDPAKADEALYLLKQEKRLREDVVTRIPEHTFPMASAWHKIRSIVIQPRNIVTATLAAAVAVLILVVWMPKPSLQPNRFIIYRPDITRAEISGSFTGWRNIPMQPVGDSGYWELVLKLPQGEHRFSYIADGTDSFPDPTIMAREMDGFGGQNSVIFVGDTI